MKIHKANKSCKLKVTKNITIRSKASHVTSKFFFFEKQNNKILRKQAKL